MRFKPVAAARQQKNTSVVERVKVTKQDRAANSASSHKRQAVRGNSDGLFALNRPESGVSPLCLIGFRCGFGGVFSIRRRFSSSLS